MRRFRVATAGVLFMLFSPVAFAAAAIPLKANVASRTSNGVRSFTVVAQTRAQAVCRVKVRLPNTSRRVVLASILADRRGRAGWTWTAARPPRGLWRFQVECGPSVKSVTIRRTRNMIVQSRFAKGTIGSQDSFRARFGRVLPNVLGKGAGFGATPNPFDWHQCTWWAYEKRPDVYEAAVKAGAPSGGSRGVVDGLVVFHWDGGQWFDRAKAAGLATGQTPKVGALVSWAGWKGVPWGHVAYVEEVRSDEWIRVSECSGLSLLCGSRWMNPKDYWGALRGYIYSSTAVTPTPPPSGGGGTPPPSTRAETTGGPTNTWTNYTNAGGTQGPTIPAFTTVQIACKLQGFKVADGNTWWYRIASGPWNSQYYASADAFYNNGATSGSLSGTPFVDAAVPNC